MKDSTIKPMTREELFRAQVLRDVLHLQTGLEDLLKTLNTPTSELDAKLAARNRARGFPKPSKSDNEQFVALPID